MTEKKFFRILSFLIIFLIIFTFSLAQALPIEVYFDPLDSAVFLGDTFSIRLAADIPDPVDKFGLDLGFDDTIISLDTFNIGDLWGPILFPPIPLFPPFDGDGLAGFALMGPVSGDDITLATFTFTALDLGTTDFTAGYTSIDPTEGFFIPLAFPMSRYAAVFIDGSVSVVPIPEPASLLLLTMGIIAGLGLGYLRRT